MVDKKEEIVYLDPLRNFNIDPEDWAFAVKDQFNKVDGGRLAELKKRSSLIISKEKCKSLRSSLGSSDLRRWGYDA